MTTELNNLIEEYKKKWDIKGVNIWWEEPFKKCFELGQKDKEKDVLKILDEWFIDNQPTKGSDYLDNELFILATESKLEELKNRIKSK